MGWLWVAHTFQMLWRNRLNVLKISLGPVVILFLLAMLVLRVTGVPFGAIIQSIATDTVDPQVAVAVGLILILVLLGLSWIAVAWHRFILLEEYPSFIPAFKGDRITAYVGRSLALGLLLVVAMIFVGGVIGLFAQVTGLARVPGVAVLLTVLQTIVISFFWLRLGIVLPATAIGRSYRLADGWRAAESHSGEIFRAAAIITVLELTFTIALETLELGVSLGLALNAISLWVSIMIGNAILTTLYGHLAEGRRLR